MEEAVLYRRQPTTWIPKEEKSSIDWLVQHAGEVQRITVQRWREDGRLVVAYLNEGWLEWVSKVSIADAVLLVGTCFPSAIVEDMAQ
jgi:hypothetical protein